MGHCVSGLTRKFELWTLLPFAVLVAYVQTDTHKKINRRETTHWAVLMLYVSFVSVCYQVSGWHYRIELTSRWREWIVTVFVAQSVRLLLAVSNRLDHFETTVSFTSCFRKAHCHSNGALIETLKSVTPVELRQSKLAKADAFFLHWMFLLMTNHRQCTLSFSIRFTRNKHSLSEQQWYCGGIDRRQPLSLGVRFVYEATEWRLFAPNVHECSSRVCSNWLCANEH